MIDRRKVLDHIRSPEEKVMLARVLDACDIVLNNYRPQGTDFYDPRRTILITSLVNSIDGLKTAAWGGYEQAERKRILLLPDNYDGEKPLPIVCLLIEGNFKMSKVTHRDYLGALLGLGIKREKLGDIVVLENGAQVFVAEEISTFITANVEKIGRVRVAVRELADQAINLPEQKFKEIRATVPSLRLDVICGASFGTSRSKIAKEIMSEKISLNWQPCSNLSQLVMEKDIISGRGRGRVEIYEVGGQTKKGRIAVVLRKYL